MQIDKLAAMPRAVWRLMDALADDRTSAADLEKILETDPALASKVLSIANSAFYGMLEPCTTIKRAVVVIGFQELEFIALGAGLAGFFDQADAPPGFDAEALWRHCLAVSWVARELAELTGQAAPGEAAASGLLHDLGKLILVAHLPDKGDLIYDQVRQGRPYHLAEEAAGVSHAEVGYWLAKRWKIPEIHAEVILNHHSISPRIPFHPQTGLTALADHLVKELEIGLVQEAPPLELGLASKSLNLTDEALADLKKRAREKLPDLLDAWRRSMQ